MQSTPGIPVQQPGHKRTERYSLCRMATDLPKSVATLLFDCQIQFSCAMNTTQFNCAMNVRISLGHAWKLCAESQHRDMRSHFHTKIDACMHIGHKFSSRRWYISSIHYEQNCHKIKAAKMAKATKNMHTLQLESNK